MHKKKVNLGGEKIHIGFAEISVLSIANPWVKFTEVWFYLAMQVLASALHLQVIYIVFCPMGTAREDEGFTTAQTGMEHCWTAGIIQQNGQEGNRGAVFISVEPKIFCHHSMFKDLLVKYI